MAKQNLRKRSDDGRTGRPGGDKQMDDEILNTEVVMEALTNTSRSSYLRGRREVVLDLHRGGGMNGMVAANELLLLLPEDFVNAYETLFWRALVDPSKSKKKEDKDEPGIAKGQTGTVLGSQTRLQAQGSGKRWKNTGFVIGSEKALQRKRWVDQKLQDLVADIERSLGTDARESLGRGDKVTGTGKGEGQKLTTRQCVGNGCKRMMDWKWNYCPSCGAGSKK